MRILNYGTGAVGLGINSCLLKSGQTVDMIARKNTAKVLNDNGLVRTGIFGDFSAPSCTFKCFTSLKEVPLQSYDFILVSTKSFDSESAAKDISQYPKLINEQTKIVLFQNGWGNAEIFTDFFPEEQIYNARVITGFSRLKPNEVEITVHADAIQLGSLFHKKIDGLKKLAAFITKGGIPAEVTQHVERDLWAKMLFNCALNPLGAILDVSYGTLEEHNYTKDIMNSIFEEIFNVMNAAGYKTHWASAKEYQDMFYSKFLPSTANHRSSTLQALKSGKRIEIEALTGIVVKLAERFSIPVPVNKTIYYVIKFLEEKNRGGQ